jgi:competence protein ComEC
MRKLYWLIIVLGFCWQVVVQLGQLWDNRVYVVFCDVGQGDATLIYRGSTQILVDAGPNERVIACLSEHIPWFDRQLELVINTHPEQDHLGGLPEVAQHYRIGTLMGNGLRGSNRAWEKLVAVLETEGTSYYQPRAGERLILDSDLQFEVLWPKAAAPGQAGQVAGISTLPTTKEDLNSLSVVLNFSYGSFDLFLSGDIGSKEELALVSERVLRPVEILKVPHHGSKYSSSAEFLAALEPQLAVIQVGKNNRFGHPTAEVLSRLDAVRARILRNDQDGQIRVASEGESFWLW